MAAINFLLNLWLCIDADYDIFFLQTSGLAGEGLFLVHFQCYLV